MSASVTFVAFVAGLLCLGAALGVRADPGQVVDKSSGTRFDEVVWVEGRAYRCLGAGVRKLALLKVYALAFCVEAEHAESLVEGYLEAHHDGLSGRELFEVLRKDEAFLDVLARSERNRLVLLQLLRDVTRRQLATNIRRTLSSILPEEKLDRVDAAITAGAKKGEVMKISAVGSTLTVDVAGSIRRVDDEEVAQKLFTVWLGPKGVSPTLRQDIARRAAGSPE